MESGTGEAPRQPVPGEAPRQPVPRPQEAKMKVKADNVRMRKYSYTQEDRQKAIQAVRDGVTPTCAQKIYGVPRMTIMDGLKGRITNPGTAGPTPVLTSEDEAKLEQCILKSASAGFSLTKEEVLTAVQVHMKRTGQPNPFNNDRPGKGWYAAFMKRHPLIVARHPEKLSTVRTSVSERFIRNWFTKVETYLRKEDQLEVLDDPTRIFNMDETSFILNPPTQTVLYLKGQKDVYNVSSTPEKTCVTTLIACRASGDYVPPMILFQYQRIPEAIKKSIPEKFALGRSDRGWMTAESFYEYINSFHNWMKEKNVKRPVILFVDGHSSHMTVPLSEFCQEKQIILVALPPSTTHIMQPLDVAVFSPFKNKWKGLVRDFKLNNGVTTINKVHFAPLLAMMVSFEVNDKNVVSGFKKSGLFPWCADNVDFTKCLKDKSKSFDENTVLPNNETEFPPTEVPQTPPERVSPTSLDEDFEISQGIPDENVQLTRSNSDDQTEAIDEPSTMNDEQSEIPNPQTPKAARNYSESRSGKKRLLRSSGMSGKEWLKESLTHGAMKEELMKKKEERMKTMIQRRNAKAAAAATQVKKTRKRKRSPTPETSDPDDPEEAIEYADSVMRKAEIVRASTSSSRRPILPRPSQNTLYMCDKCNRSFIRPADLKKHRLVHSQYSCKQCILMFDTSKEMEDHMKSIHSKRALYQCDVCNLTFTLRKSLVEHRKRHSLKPNFICHECKLSFDCSSDLQVERCKGNHTPQPDTPVALPEQSSRTTPNDDTLIESTSTTEHRVQRLSASRKLHFPLPEDASQTKRWRHKRKFMDPDKFNQFLESEAERMKTYRQRRTEEQKARDKVTGKLRSRNYRQRKNKTVQSLKKNQKKIAEMTKEEKQEYDRARKAESRAKMNPQKKVQVKEREKSYKEKRKIKQKSQSFDVAKYQELIPIEGAGLEFQFF